MQLKFTKPPRYIFKQRPNDVIGVKDFEHDKNKKVFDLPSGTYYFWLSFNPSPKDYPYYHVYRVEISKSKISLLKKLPKDADYIFVGRREEHILLGKFPLYDEELTDE